MTRPETLKAIGTLEALAASSNSTEEYLKYFVKSNDLRASIEPLSGEENYQIAQTMLEALGTYDA